MIYDPERWKAGELMAIDHKDYILALDRFVNIAPQRNVLLVYGLKSIGKSRQLLLKVDEWRREKRLVLDVDLKGKDISPEEVLKLLLQEYCRETRQINPEKTFKEVIISFFGNEFQRVSSIMEKINLALNPSLNTAAWTNTVAGVILDEFKKEEQDGKVRDNLSEFLNKLEMEAEEGNRPILVIREAQKLVDESLPMETKRVFKALLQCFESYSDGKKNVSIIIESSEYTLANLRQYIISSPQSFHYAKLNHGRKMLVTRNWSSDIRCSPRKNTREFGIQ